jgi:hypothetical protein
LLQPLHSLVQSIIKNDLGMISLEIIARTRRVHFGGDLLDLVDCHYSKAAAAIARP